MMYLVYCKTFCNCHQHNNKKGKNLIKENYQNEETIHIVGEIFTVYLSETEFISEYIKNSRREKKDGNSVASSNISPHTKLNCPFHTKLSPEKLWKSGLASRWTG
jgi:hypothetical protein